VEQILVILGALVTLVLSIAGMNIYRQRTDVLTGPYIRGSAADYPLAAARRLTSLSSSPVLGHLARSQRLSDAIQNLLFQGMDLVRRVRRKLFPRARRR
jgi:hypothetical protein